MNGLLELPFINATVFIFSEILNIAGFIISIRVVRASWETMQEVILMQTIINNSRMVPFVLET
ncbi:MAG TPA: hypothetical protein VFC67_13435 [Prolixibacteraceae bacterium]|nr:hypothetical protein [Prolixibacteraceae bacterium]